MRQSVIRLQLQIQLRIVGGRRSVGGPADSSLSNNHGTFEQREYRQRQQPAVTSHAWRQSVCLTPTLDSGRQRHSAVT